MSRLLLGPNLHLYEDGTPPVVSVAARAAAVALPPPELPPYNGKLMGRELTVTANGGLTWRHTGTVPLVDATMAGAVLTVSEYGTIEWAYPQGGGPAPTGGEDEVFVGDVEPAKPVELWYDPSETTKSWERKQAARRDQT